MYVRKQKLPRQGTPSGGTTNLSKHKQRFREDFTYGLTQ